MTDLIASAGSGEDATPLWFVSKGDDLPADLPKLAAAWMKSTGAEAEPGRAVMLPSETGALAGVLFGVDPKGDPFAPGAVAASLGAGLYRFALPPQDRRLAALGYVLHSYRYDRYSRGKTTQARLEVPQGVDEAWLRYTIEAVTLARDLINTPANDMGPQELEDAARRLAGKHEADISVITGDALLQQGFPMIHAVGRASDRAPRLIDMAWGADDAPKVTLVGKGVCFDTGGVNVKPDAAMRNMKKDMGGAATVLALAHLVMAAKLPIRLRVLIPAVENAIGGSSFRPGDILHSRKGLTVEIGHTDAEGRLVLGDALALADEEAPELLLDFATLTGAARVALGPDLPPFYTDDDQVAADLARHATTENDPLWRLPLWQPYNKMIEPKIADLTNSASGGFAGSITAALFLAHFVEKAKTWVHFDVFGWTPTAKPGRPEGGECQGARAAFALLAERYGR
ncbi:aminopeptidase [Agaricicola taiwanensis]|uniref:Aminopeptidase n=1 Tax=Agaricicola taiwanensis TaxID=591372 RepID=A0A8J2YG31_9RHOB|nr:leucyl aminopeptidase family protein [Agaricicola taiwanensis]GGE33253.1 aminopeptidase [Agaricicola taiwanensis]